MDLLEVGGEVLHPDVLDHLEADDLVEAPGHVAVVPHFDLRAIGDAVGGDACGPEVDLLARERHAMRPRAEVTGRASNERPPAAADVEQRLAG